MAATRAALAPHALRDSGQDEEGDEPGSQGCPCRQGVEPTAAGQQPQQQGRATSSMLDYAAGRGVDDGSSSQRDQRQGGSRAIILGDRPRGGRLVFFFNGSRWSRPGVSKLAQREEAAPVDDAAMAAMAEDAKTGGDARKSRWPPKGEAAEKKKGEKQKKISFLSRAPPDRLPLSRDASPRTVPPGVFPPPRTLR